MIKGVNKQVLEINETQNTFFEKAIFFVKPEYTGLSEGRLRESAKKELDTTGTPPLQQKFSYVHKKFFLICTICLAIGFVAGIVGASLFE